jgi:hypothetical protein
MTWKLEGAAVINGLVPNINLGGTRIESPEVPAFGAQLTIVAYMPGEKEASRLCNSACSVPGTRTGLST